jgi:hypothetical protein
VPGLIEESSGGKGRGAGIRGTESDLRGEGPLFLLPARRDRDVTINQPPTCRTCGVMVEHPGRHREWHLALERLIPGLGAELESARSGEEPGGDFTF